MRALTLAARRVSFVRAVARAAAARRAVVRGAAIRAAVRRVASARALATAAVAVGATTLTACAAKQILETGGRGYEDDVVIPVFRSAAADVAAKFLAKDMYGGERAQIEKGIQQLMQASLAQRGFVVEQVLLKSIRLPSDLAQAVEDKLAAEQRAEQMRFVLDRERSEAERKRIEAEGTKQAQDIIASSLTPMIISFRSIEAFRELAASPDAKVVVTDGRTPYLIAPEQGAAAAAAYDAEARRSAARSGAGPAARPAPRVGATAPDARGAARARLAERAP